jgi:hypothetical protein
MDVFRMNFGGRSRAPVAGVLLRRTAVPAFASAVSASLAELGIFR